MRMMRKGVKGRLAVVHSQWLARWQLAGTQTKQIRVARTGRLVVVALLRILGIFAQPFGHRVRIPHLDRAIRRAREHAPRRGTAAERKRRNTQRLNDARMRTGVCVDAALVV